MQMFYCFNLIANIRFSVSILIETNIDIGNELNFSYVHRNVQYIGSLAKFTGVHSLCTRPKMKFIPETK